MLPNNFRSQEYGGDFNERLQESLDLLDSALPINVKAYGAVGDGVTDDTATIQRALNAAASADFGPGFGDKNVIFPPGRYVVTALTVGFRTTLRFIGAVLAPLSSVGAQTHLIKFADFCRTYDMVIDMNYCINYDSSAWCRGRYIEHVDSEIWKAKSAWLFGDPAWANDPNSGALGDSEITISGGNTTWCIQAARGYGQNTIVNFTGGWKGYSFQDTLDVADPRRPAWMALPVITFDNTGGIFYLNGIAIANFSNVTPVLVSRIQPTNNPAYQNSFGKFVLTGTHIEGGILFNTAAPGAVAVEDESSHCLLVQNCTGYISPGRAGYYVDAGYTKQAITINNCGFYGGVGSLLLYADSGRSFIDVKSFAGIVGDKYAGVAAAHPTGYTDFLFFNRNGSSQALTGAPVTLTWANSATGDYPAGYAVPAYNAGTFTMPATARNVRVRVSLLMTGGASADETDLFLFINGVQTEVRVAYGLRPSVEFNIPQLNKNDQIRIDCASIPGRTLAGGADIRILIVGNC